MRESIPGVTLRSPWRNVYPTSMSRAKDLLIVGLALCSGGLGLLAWRQHLELRKFARGDGAASIERRGSTITVRPAAQRKLALAPTRPESSGVVEREDGMMGFVPGSFPPATLPPPRRRGSALMRLLERPEFVQALHLQRQAMLDSRFGELFRRLNLEGDELVAFKRLLAEKENVALDVVTVSETAPEGPLSPEGMRASIRAAQTQIEQAIHSSLGSDRYAVYREYERTLAQRATVAQLEQRLSYTRAPLTPTQAEAVVRILATNTTAAAEQPGPPPVSVLVRAGVPEAVPILPTSAATGRVTDEVVSQAQAVLTPTQVGALREIQLEQQAAMKAAQMIRDVAPAAAEIIPTWPTLLLH